MPGPFHQLRRFLRELKRRKVYRVAAVYLVSAFVVVQLAALAGDAFGLPPWFEPMVWALCGLGLPLALVLAWAFEVTPEGVRRTEPASEEAKGERAEAWSAGKRAGAIGLLLLAVVLSAWWVLRPGGGPEPARAEERSVAVLPFDDLSAGPQQAGIGTGLTETIIAQLSLVDDLSVVSRTSVMPYRETDLRLPEIADSLGVEHIVEGSVQRSGDRLRIVAQLIRADTDRHLWAETFDREFSDIFRIQSEVAVRIAEALEAELAAETRGRIEERPTENPEAYDLYLRGVELSDRSREDNRAAVELLRQAIAMDSTFALARAGLANAYMHRAQDFGYPHAWYDSALATARRAVELDRELAQGHKEVATALVHLGQLEAATEAFRRAIALRPGYAGAMHNLGLAYAGQGQYAKAFPWYWRSLPKMPNGPYSIRSIGAALYLFGKDEAAEAWMGRLVETGGPRWEDWRLILDFCRGRMQAARGHLQALREWNADAASTLNWSGMLAQLDGRPERAVEHYRPAYERRPDYRGPDPSPRLRLAQALQSVGREEEARTLLEEARRWNRSLIEKGSEASGPRVRLAAAYLLRGQTRRAYRWLDSAYVAGFRWHPWVRHAPLFRRIREEGRFQQLLARMEKDLRRQRDDVRAWARGEGIEWPPLRAGALSRSGSGRRSRRATPGSSSAGD